MLSIDEVINKAQTYDVRDEWLEDSEYADSNIKLNMFRRCILLLCMKLKQRGFQGIEIEKKENFFCFESLKNVERNEQKFYCTDETYTSIFKEFLIFYNWEIENEYSWGVYLENSNKNETVENMICDLMSELVDIDYIEKNKKYYIHEEDSSQYSVSDIILEEYSEQTYFYSFHNPLVDEVHKLYKKLPYIKEVQQQYKEICCYLDDILGIFGDGPYYRNIEEIREGYYVYTIGGIYYTSFYGTIYDYDLFLSFRLDLLRKIPELDVKMKEFLEKWKSNVE